jgi:hypothetical protein
MTAVGPLPFSLGILNEPITWTLKVLDKTDKEVSSKDFVSGPHKIYVTHGTPIEVTTLYKTVTVHPPWLNGIGKRALATNVVTDKKLDILLADYSEETWGIAGGLTDVEEIVEATHAFLNNANIIVSPGTTTCFAADGKTEYMWSIFSGDYSARCVERSLLMEIFLGSMGIKSTALQVKASNTVEFPIEFMVMEKEVEYRSRPLPTPDEWLLMDFAAPPAGGRINVGEGMTKVDLSQGVGTKKERYFPHAVAEKNDENRKALVAGTPCGVLKKIKTELGFEFQRWCKKSDGVTWDCSDREPLPDCTE